MNTRPFGRTGRSVSEIGLGTWQLGGGWGEVTDATALDTLRAAYDKGVTFFDTADVYGGGRSETLIGQFIREQPAARETVFIATKLGRNNWPNGFTRDQVRGFTEASLQRLGVDALDLTQLHCIPPDVLKRGEVLTWLEELKREGKIKAYGASVEAMDEALFCVEQGGCTSLQIIFNVLRQKPISTLFAAAKAKQVALIVRLPLASGLLGGKMTKQTAFKADDHRLFNRDGQHFNVGETFSGLPFEKGVELADALKSRVPAGVSMAAWALRWCLDFEAVTVVIPGARNPKQVADNVAAAALSPLGAAMHADLAAFYESEVAAHIRGLY
ncbi:aldo/keto reductase [Rariglobus hedericola]|uniref:Aldo/keto reductase n=1 Tax=Rariglobus hedericola TaxID=2597822 RepID=A0A556QK80_9BACT|nr:aldo/keto reductase [Rariglobus hedericola]TSJ77031.1 aldo/keto reductase [Rariglobus hedericola]